MATDFESYLVFAGLCLLAAYSARTFISSISERVLQQVQEAHKEAKRAGETAENAQATAADAREAVQAVSSEVEDIDQTSAPSPELAADRRTVLKKGSPPVAINSDERSALEALSKKVYRTRTGVAEDSGIAINRISEVLDDLAAKKLALETKSPSSGGRRWAISKRGEHALAASAQVQ